MATQLRPDPTFYPSPKLAMEAPREKFAFVALLRPDHTRPDAIAVVDARPESTTYGRTVHTVELSAAGDELHHFGWNACSSMLCPTNGHPFTERRYLIVPGMRSSRLYIVDTKPDPTQARVVKVIEPEEMILAVHDHSPARDGTAGCVITGPRLVRWDQHRQWRQLVRCCASARPGRSVR